jgi:hypothetical protein
MDALASIRDLHDSSTTAMRVAGIDRIKFNEAIADGFYRCAPATSPGRERVFDSIDIIGMFVFGRLVAIGFSARYAGNYASEVVEAIRGKTKSANMRITKTEKELIFRLQPGDGEPKEYWIGIEFNITAISNELARRFKEITAIWTSPPAAKGRKGSKS